MGVITLALIVSHHQSGAFHVPLWVKISAATAMAAGTYAGGWRIIRTLGQRVAKLQPPQGFAAQTSTAAILWVTARYGYPVSTTHTITGSVLGAGATTRLSAVRWGVARSIVLAWLITIPCAGLVGAGMGAGPPPRVVASESRGTRALTIAQIYNGAAPGVVQVTSTTKVKIPQDPFFPNLFGQGGTQTQQALGSGFVIDKAGYIVTNYHVVSNAQSVEV